MRKFLFSCICAVCGIAAHSADFQSGKLYYNIVSEDDLTCEVAAPPDVDKSPYIFNSYLSIPVEVQHDGKAYMVIGVGANAFKYAYINGSVYLNNADSHIRYVGNRAFMSADVKAFQLGKIEEIGDSAFYDCQYTQTMSIPKTVKRIGDYAFAECYELSRISFVYGSVLESIGKYAFRHCPITSIALPDAISEIPEGLFSFCTDLSEITFPKSLKSVGELAFLNCIGFSEMTLPEGVVNVGSKIFSQCENLETVNLPRSLTALSSQMFFYCTGLKKINLSPLLTDLGDAPFYQCNSLESFAIPPLVTKLDGTFGSCTGLKEVVFPNDCLIDRIGQYTFAYCSSLESLELPNSIEYIDMCAFGGCASLKSIVFGTGLKKIDYYAFTEGTDRTVAPDAITCLGPQPPEFYISVPGWAEVDPFEPAVYENATLTVPSESVLKYKEAEIWSKFINVNSFTGVSSVENDATTSSDMVRIYTVSGTLVYSGPEDGVTTLLPGVYIKVIGDKRIKLLI